MEYHAHQSHHKHHAGAAVTDKRQRDAFERQYPEHGADVNERLHRQPNQDTRHQQAGKIVWRSFHDPFYAGKKRQKQRQQHRHPKKPEFLGIDREDRVVLGLRQIPKSLYAIPEPEPDHTAGADGNQRLARLVTCC